MDRQRERRVVCDIGYRTRLATLPQNFCDLGNKSYADSVYLWSEWPRRADLETGLDDSLTYGKALSHVPEGPI